jgi:phosphatidylserine/phosphatidylglycerophosphate/cardiolipin synthase-like enzyme
MLTQRYTNPIDVSAADVATITAATATIDFAAYTLTHAQIITALLARARAGVQVRLYLDRTELEAEARGNPTLSNSALGPLLSTPNVQTKVKQSSILMHLKSYLVDSKLLRDGSANFSPLGESEQDNSMLLTDDGPTVALFEAKFAAMWNRPDNISVAQAILTGHNPATTAHHSH